MSLIYIFTGDGKGKTTAAFGTALRSLARGLEVYIVQFMKHEDWFDVGEVKFLRSVSDKVHIFPYGRRGWVNPKNPSEEDIQIATNAYLKCIEIVNDSKPFLLIADEILVTYLFKMLSSEKILLLMKISKENNVNLILTGRGGDEVIFDRADLVSEMSLVKHHYDKGMNAVEGLEY